MGSVDDQSFRPVTVRYAILLYEALNSPKAPTSRFVTFLSVKNLVSSTMFPKLIVPAVEKP